MELFQLRHFYATARNGNMTKAADEIMVAQPALSKSIRNLENELGAVLFIRNNKGMKLTVQGKILMKYCVRIFSLLDDMNDEISQSLISNRKLRICLRAGGEMIGAALSDFARQNPDIPICISGNDSKNCDFLIDSAFSREIPENTGILIREELCLAAADVHPLAHYQAIPFTALKGEKFICLSDSRSFQQTFEYLLNKADIRASVECSCGNLQLLQELVSRNMGISVAASVSWKHSSPPGNIRLIPFKEKIFRCLYYDKRPNPFQFEAVETFEKTLVLHFRNLEKGK